MFNAFTTAAIALVVLVALGGALANRYLPRPETTRPLPGNLNVMVDDDDFTAADKRNMKTVIIRWADIHRITMITTDTGPFVDDRFYHIVHANGELTLPAHAGGMDDFLARITALPGFDAQALKTALTSMKNNSFSVVFSAS